MSSSIITTEKAEEICTSLGYDTLVAYQKANGLPQTGVLDTQTERHLLQIRYCSLPDYFTLDARSMPLPKWPITDLTWAFTHSFQLPGFSRDDSVDVFTWVWQQWANVSPLRFTYRVNNPENANILISSGRIDGPSNTLAWSELPPARQVRQKYDLEPYVFSGNPPAGKIDLGAVGVHEGGHALGISHAPNTADGRSALMAPIYNPLVRTPQKWDIAQIQSRYGMPTSPIPTTPKTPDDPTSPPPTGPNDAKSPWKSGVDYTLESGYICCAVPIAHIAPQYRPKTNQ